MTGTHTGGNLWNAGTMNNILAVVALILTGCAWTSASGAENEPEKYESKRSKWYASVGIGGNSASGTHEGWNRDTTCYPTYDCFSGGSPAPSGYRWHYDIEEKYGHRGEISIGRVYHRLRFDISLALQKNDVEQTFKKLTDFDGTPLNPSNNTIQSCSETRIDDLTLRTLSFNTYYDFLNTSRWTPYLGGGLGLASAKISGLYFDSQYKDTAVPPGNYDPPLSFYTSHSEKDISDRVLFWQLYLGIDYNLNDKIVLGIKTTYSRTGELKDEGKYSVHPMNASDPDFTATETISEMNRWSWMFIVKRLF